MAIKNFADMFSGVHRILACDRRMDSLGSYLMGFMGSTPKIMMIKMLICSFQSVFSTYWFNGHSISISLCRLLTVNFLKIQSKWLLSSLDLVQIHQKSFVGRATPGFAGGAYSAPHTP